jgi:hypothetical protein
MTTYTYRLADVDGTLCVVCSAPDWSKPEIISNFWPTKERTRWLLRSHFDTEEAEADENWPTMLAEYAVKQSIPGEYVIEPPRRSWSVTGVYLSLVNGGRTESIKTTSQPAPRPKTRLPLEWDQGRWWKNTKAKWVPA